MIIIFGYRTPSATELPTVLYIGEDGDEANRLCETSPYPRIGRLDNPQVRPYKHWDPDASAAFEKKHGKKLAEPVTAPVVATLNPLPPPEPDAPEIPVPPVDAEQDGLEELTIEDLKGVADDEGIDVSGSKLKQDYLDTIRLYRQLDEDHNAEEIHQLAESEGVDGTGLKLKRDFLNALVAHRRRANFPG